MKKHVKRSLLALLVLALVLVPVLALSASAEYAETAEWMNTNPNAPTDYAFSLAVIGDTQIIVEEDAKSRADDDPSNDTNYTASIYNWIVANAGAKKMQYVLGLGDITYGDTDAEWEVAKEAITKMNGVVPYTLVKGAPPHDSGGRFNRYFSTEEGFTSTIDGYYEDGVILNTFSTFTVGEVDYLILALDFAAPDPILEWAGSVISSDEYKNHKVIITTHSYLWKDGTPVDQNAPTTALPDKPEYTSDDKYNNGDEMWDKFVSKYENICMILCGHFTNNDIVASQKVGDHGNIVTQMMINPQSFDNANNCETGMVAMLYFSEDGNDVSVEYYSTYRNQFYRDVNQFEFSLDEMTLNVGELTEYGLIPARSYDPENYPYALFKKTPSYYDGVKYDYTFVGAYKTLMGDASVNASTNEDRAYHHARMTAKDGAVILLLRDIDNKDDYAYSNLQYHPGNLTLDLGGHTMIDSHTYSTGLFYMHMKTSNNMMKLTVKNGSFVIGDNDIISYGGSSAFTDFTGAVTFENVDFSWKEGSSATHFVRKYTGRYSNFIPVVFDGCTFDMTNAADGFRFSQEEHAGSVTVKNSHILNSKYSYNVNEYGYAETKPTELEHIALYKNVPSSVSADGATFVSDYTFSAYYKALYSNSSLGIITTTGAYHAARTLTEKGSEATLVLLTDHEITSDADYSNICYNMKDVTFDLRGFTLTDSNTHNESTLYLYIKNKSGYPGSTFTIKNGNMVLGDEAVCSYLVSRSTYGVHLVFDGINFSWKEGSTATAFLGTTSYREKNSITLTDCVIDLENANSGMKLESSGKLTGVYFNNTLIINSKDTAVYTADESDLLDGSYYIGKYGIIPYLASDAEKYPFISYQEKSVTVDGIAYSYSFYKAHTCLTGGAADEELGIAAFRYGGSGTVLQMRRDFTDTTSSNYTNLCYSGAVGIFDLGGYTLYDARTSSTALFHNHLKYANQHTTITVTGGSIVLGNKGLTSYDFWAEAAESSLKLVFDGVNISLKDGATITYFVGKSATDADSYTVDFVNCVIDLANAPAGFKLKADGSIPGGVEVTLTDTEIVGSQDILPKQNITLYTDFVYNAYIPTTAGSSAVTITSASLGGVPFDLSACEIVTVEGEQYYKLSIHVAPTAAADEMELVVYVNYTYTYKDGTTKVTASQLDWKVSVLSYLKTLVEDSTGIDNTLAKDILSYIRAAYVYEGTSEKLDYVKEFVDAINGADYDAANLPTAAEVKQTVDGMDSAQLLLGSAPAFIFYPETDADGNLVYSTDSYVFALDGKYRLTAEVGVDGSGKTYIIVSLPAWALDNDVEYIVNGTDVGGVYNLAAYYEYAKGTENANLISLVERLMKYAETAEAYKNSL